MEIEGLSVDGHAGKWQVIIFSEESEVIYKITVLRSFPSPPSEARLQSERDWLNDRRVPAGTRYTICFSFGLDGHRGGKRGKFLVAHSRVPH